MTGSLQVKNDKYYVVTRVPDDTGKLKQKWVSTGITVKGNNKRKAQQKMKEIIAELEREQELNLRSGEVLFTDWIEKWLEIKKSTVRLNTYESYRMYYDKHIKPYFSAKNIKLKEVTAEVLEDYYAQKKAEGQSGNSIKKHNVVLQGALADAVRKKKIDTNPALNAIRPRVEKFEGKAYTVAEAQALISVLDNEAIKPAVVLGLFYGLRRSEVCGLRWKDIDFEAGTMQIRNTVVKTKTVIESENTKNSASNATLLLLSETIPYLKELKEKQDRFRVRTSNTYNDTQGHVCVHENGKPFSPDYVSRAFRSLLKRHNLPHIRFHELRHTAGSLLVEGGLTAKQIQAILRHEDISTTMNTYAHLSIEGKKEAAIRLGSILGKV